MYQNDVFYDEIKIQIKKYVSNAKSSVLLSMYLLTDNELIDLLIKKKNENVDVQIILDDNEKNRKSIGNLNLDVIWIKHNENKHTKKNFNCMHMKSCIIDFKKLLVGSYNWTNNAPGNNENLFILYDQNIIKKSVDEFNRLKYAK